MLGQTEIVTKIASISHTGQYPFMGKTFYKFDIVTSEGMTLRADSTSTSPWWKTYDQAVKLINKNKKIDGLECVKINRIEEAAESNESHTNQTDNIQANSVSFTSGPGNIGVEVGQALNKAVDIMVATSFKENGLNPDSFEDELKELAKIILKVGSELRNNK